MTSRTLEDFSDFLDGQKAAELARLGLSAHATKPGRDKNCANHILNATSPFMVVSAL